MHLHLPLGTVLNLNLLERFFFIIKDFLDYTCPVDQAIAKCNTHPSIITTKNKVLTVLNKRRFSFIMIEKRGYRYRSSRPEVFCKNGVLKNFAKFIGKHLRQRSGACNFI